MPLGGRAAAGSAEHPADRLALDNPYFARGPRHVGYVLAASVVMLPLLVPSGPGNTALADVGILALVVVVFVWLRHEQVRVAVPYLLPMGLLVMAGVASAFQSGAESAVLAVVQDIFCLLWAAAIANAVRRRRWLLDVLLRAWVWSGVVWAGVLCVGRIAGISWMAGLSAKDGGRASLTFDDPNLAANYFLVCIALILATSVIRRVLTRVPRHRPGPAGHHLHGLERRSGRPRDPGRGGTAPRNPPTTGRPGRRGGCLPGRSRGAPSPPRT